MIKQPPIDLGRNKKLEYSKKAFQWFRRRKWKLRVDKTVYIRTRGWRKAVYVGNDYFTLIPGGMVVRKGYSWDGASGPTIDTRNTVVGSLVHDVLYQACREGMIEFECWKDADKVLRRVLREQGEMAWLRRNLWYSGLWAMRGRAARPAKTA